MPLLITIALIAVGWAMLIRPQQQRLKEQKALVAAVEVGDEVITAGGIHGRITAVAEATVQIEVAPGVELTLARPAIARRVVAEPAQGEQASMQVEDTVGDDVQATNGEAGA